jgi:hypothetical protein
MAVAHLAREKISPGRRESRYDRHEAHLQNIVVARLTHPGGATNNSLVDFPPAGKKVFLED